MRDASHSEETSRYAALRRPMQAALGLLLLALAGFTAGCADTIEPPQDMVAFDPPEAAAPIEKDGSIAPPPPMVEPDPDRGMAIFVGEEGGGQACSSCHSLGDNVLLGPGLQGLYQRAGTRVSGLSAEEYVVQSIRQPAEFLVEDFNNLMPVFGEAELSDTQLEDLLAFLEGL